jgi:UPF0271 protein
MIINCDLGEIEDLELADKIMAHIDAANIACTYHAGSEELMRASIQLAVKHKIMIGAHPGYKDKENFGRLPMQLEEDALRSLIMDQLQLIDQACEDYHAKLSHVKLHGALYNQAMSDKAMARIILDTIKDFDQNLSVYGLSDSSFLSIGKQMGLTMLSECFADRRYDNTSLVARQKNGLIHDLKEIESQYRAFLKGKVIDINKKSIKLSCDTVCVHGDHPMSFDVLNMMERVNDSENK